MYLQFRRTWMGGLLALSLTACRSHTNKISENLLYGVWNVRSIATPERTSTGAEMGDPQYEFTKDGQRIKSYKEPPIKESVRYVYQDGKISYPDNPKLPAVRVLRLDKDSLILQSEKATWRLYR